MRFARHSFSVCTVTCMAHWTGSCAVTLACGAGERGAGDGGGRVAWAVVTDFRSFIKIATRRHRRKLAVLGSKSKVNDAIREDRGQAVTLANSLAKNAAGRERPKIIKEREGNQPNNAEYRGVEAAHEKSPPVHSAALARVAVNSRIAADTRRARGTSKCIESINSGKSASPSPGKSRRNLTVCPSLRTME